MSKWRPTPLNALYVIPDINGRYGLFDLICSRILPLRKSDGGNDKLIFLGNYICDTPESFDIIDRIIDIKNKHKDFVHCLLGSNELTFMRALGLVSLKNDEVFFRNWWMRVGRTLLAKITSDPEIPQYRLKSIVPSKYIEFISTLEKYTIEDDFLFVHSGFKPDTPIAEQDVFDLTYNKHHSELVCSGSSLETDKTIVTGHATDRGPIISDRFLMLDTGEKSNMLVVELHSLEAFLAQKNKDRMVAFDLFDHVSMKD